MENKAQGKLKFVYIVVMRQVSKTHAYKAKNKMHNLKGTRPHSRIGCACRPVSFSSCLNLVLYWNKGSRKWNRKCLILRRRQAFLLLAPRSWNSSRIYNQSVLWPWLLADLRLFSVVFNTKRSKYKTKMRLTFNHADAWRYLNGFWLAVPVDVISLWNVCLQSTFFVSIILFFFIFIYWYFLLFT